MSDATLSLAVRGTIGKLPHREGDLVAKDEVLLEMEASVEEFEVKRRAVVLDAAQKDFERTKQLFERTQAVSQEELDQKESGFRIAETEHELAKAELRRRQVTAPFAGRIIDCFDLEVGESVEIQQPLVRLADPKKCKFTCHLKGTADHGFAAGDKVKLKIEMQSGEVIKEGSIDFISPIVDPASGLRRVRAVFDNADEKIPPGVSAFLLLDSKDGS